MPKAYKAKYIIASDGNLYENCSLVVDEGKVEYIVKTEDLNHEEIKHIKDYSDSIITPGFVNLHSHLQYSNVHPQKRCFRHKLKQVYTDIKKYYYLAGIDKNKFIYRFASLLSNYFCLSRENKFASFKLGLEKSLLAGTTCISQLSQESKYFEIFNESPIKTMIFFELFSDSADKSKEEFRIIQKKIDKLLKQKSDSTFIGVAPYSMCSSHKRLYKILSKYCKKNNLIMTTILAQSKAEMSWLKFGFSDIDLLNAFTGNKKFEPAIKGISPTQFLENVKALNKRTLISYGNFLEQSDLEDLQKNNVALAYCPRVSDKIHNKKLDLDTVLKYFKDRFGFGTENLEFNDDLSLLNELKSVNNGQLDALEAIKYLTIVPAKILRLDNTIGSLEAKKDADFNVFKLKDNEDFSAILNKTNPDYVYIKGQRKVHKGQLRNK